MVYHFKNWMKGWDARIDTYDNQIELQGRKGKIRECWSVINDFLNMTDSNVMKGKDGIQAGKALVDNQNKKWYKALREVSDTLTVLEFEMEKMMEMNSRKTAEIYRLRNEVGRLRETEQNSI